MNNKLAVLLIAVCAALGQSPDAFTGTWKLNAGRTTGGYKAGIRTYQPVAGGTQVTYSMTRTDGHEINGEYTVQCHGKKCTSDQANWMRKDARTVAGQVVENGKGAEKYVRAVSADGKTMTITFYPPGGKNKKAPVSIQIWEKQ